jgi:hypothetical protein
MALFDQLAEMLGGAAVPGSMTQKMALMGSPLISALLAKHGAADVPEAGAGPDVGPEGPKVGADLADPVAKTANVLDGLKSFDDQPQISSIGDAVDTGKDSIFGDAGMAGIKSALAENAAKPRGFLDRIGDFLGSDEGRAALLRSGAATLQGGLGAGIQAGADFVDRRRHERAAAASADADRQLDRERMNNTYNLGLGRLGIDSENSLETSRHNRAVEGNDTYRVDADLYKHRNPSGDVRTRAAVDLHTHDTPSGDTRLTTQERRFEHITPSGDTTTTQAAETARNTQDNQTQLMKEQMSRTPRINIHARYQTTPEEFQRNGPRLARPSEVKPQANTGADEVRYDAQGLAYKRGPNGEAMRAPEFDRR